MTDSISLHFDLIPLKGLRFGLLSRKWTTRSDMMTALELRWWPFEGGQQAIGLSFSYSAYKTSAELIAEHLELRGAINKLMTDSGISRLEQI